MENYKTEIAATIATIVSGGIAWFLGGKQQVKKESQDTLTSGADKIVDTSNKLLDRLQQLLEEETIHKENCERSLKEHKERLDVLRQEVDELKSYKNENSNSNRA